MPTRLAEATANTKCDAAVDSIDVGATNPAGQVRVYTGTQPATPEDPPTGTLLVTVELDNPAFGDAGVTTAGVASLAGVPLSGTGAADGTAGWVRIVSAGEAAVVDGEAGATGSGALIEMSTLEVSTGLTVNVTGGTWTEPLA